MALTHRATFAAGVPALLLAAAVSGCLGGSTSEWAYDAVGIRTLQDDGLDGEGIVVAIIDTGIDAGHPSLDGATIRAWKDYVNDRSEPYDDNGHGSHVAGIMVGEGADFEGRLSGFDLKGGARSVSLIIVKAISENSEGNSADVVAGIDFARRNNADIICLSLGSSPNALRNVVPDAISTSINQALDQGILVVAAAGNTGPENSDVETPSNVQGVIAVGAVDQDKKLAEFSARGDNGGFVAGIGQRNDPHKKPEVVAPGVKIKSAWKDGSYAVASGTSQAVPFVCSGLALLLEDKPDLRDDDTRAMVDRVKSRMMQTADPLPGQVTPHDDRAGYGLYDGVGLVQAFG
jgi:serine protease AprX